MPKKSVAVRMVMNAKLRFSRLKAFWKESRHRITWM